MKKLLITLMVMIMAFVLLAGCKDDGPITPDQATKIVLEELGLNPADVTVHTHAGSHEGQPCHIIYVTQGDHTIEYLVHGVTGEILSYGESSHSH